MAAPPEPLNDPEAGSPEIAVRFNRTSAAWWLVIGTAMLFAILLYDLVSDRRLFFQYGATFRIVLAYFAAIALWVTSTIQIIRSHYFTYRPDPGTLVVNGGRTYPRTGYQWLGRSERGEVFEFGPGGAIRRIPVSRSKAEPQDWEAFVNELDLLDGDDLPNPDASR